MLVMLRRRDASPVLLRPQLAATVVSAVTAAGLLTLLCGWPYWREHAGAAAVNVADSAALVAAGALLLPSAATRRCGLLLALAGLAWGTSWLISWNAGPLPLIALFGQSVFFLLIGWGILLFPQGHLRGWPDRLWIAAAVVSLLLGQLILVVTSEPEWNGFAADVFWPTLVSNRELFNGAAAALFASYLVLAAGFAAVLLRRATLLKGLGKAFALPVLACVALMGIISAIAAEPAMTSADLASVERVFAVQGAAIVLVPISLLAVGLRRRLAEVTVAERLLRAVAAPATVDRVRAVLRSVLKDPTLEVYFWVREQNGYVDAGGRPVDIALDSPLDRRPRATHDDARWRRAVQTSLGEPLAIVDADAAGLEGHRNLVDAALSVGRLALERAQLQAVVQAHLEQIRAAQRRIVETEASERKRLERDLHDGAQQRLVAAAMTLAAAEATTSDPATGEAIDQARKDLLKALIELRALARGIHPTELSEDGLGPALEVVAERLHLPVRIRVPAQRLPAAVETTAYFALCEALTNAAKHARASLVRIEVGIEVGMDGGMLVAEVADDGVGGASMNPGGGLAGLADRVHTLGGTVEVESARAAGTRVRVMLPCA
jgi:signal transduction histidine kinase